ncbi:MAG: RtcB family protein [Candidatus Methanoperedens sp.]|nr:RtcB family protein [Candidatus Methanoperedens sp.]
MEIRKISDYIWEIPATEKERMLVPARIYATEKLLGEMDKGSYLLVGTEKAMKETFGSTMHGSGRTMSRTAAKKKVVGAELKKEMAGVSRKVVGLRPIGNIKG